MNSHKNARLTFEGRKLLLERIAALGLTSAAHAAGVSANTARKWRARFLSGGIQALADRSSRPEKTRTTIDTVQRDRIEALRRARMPMRCIAKHVGRSVATISRLLAGMGLSSLKSLDPKVVIMRYEHDAPGDLLHLDTKKLGRIVEPGHRATGDPRDHIRGAGWEYAHVAIDDHSRLSFVMVYENERKETAVQFLLAAVAHYESIGIKIKRLLTDNGNPYRSELFANTCHALGIRHTFTRPYRPQTNGKAERFIQTCLREWAYARTWISSAERTEWLTSFLNYYNGRRPHSALNYNAPASRLPTNNLLQLNKVDRTGYLVDVLAARTLRAYGREHHLGFNKRDG